MRPLVAWRILTQRWRRFAGSSAAATVSRRLAGGEEHAGDVQEDLGRRPGGRRLRTARHSQLGVHER